MRNRVAVLHGVNLDMLDRRPAEHYGGLTFTRLEWTIEQFARELGLEPRFFQSNHEGEFVEELHKASDYADGLLLNPGAWTHYAWSLRDAVELTGPARRRGPPLRRRQPRALARGLRAGATSRGRRQRARGPTATATRSRGSRQAL